MTLMKSAPATHNLPPRWPRLVIAGLTLGAALSLLAVYHLAYIQATSTLIHESAATAQLQVAVLQSELDKQRSAPVILADDSAVMEALLEPSAVRLHAISLKLEKLQRETKSADIYLLNAQGVAVAASNWALPTSFVGSNYSFRDYFKAALRTGTAEQFALGTVSRRPGLYLAHSVNVDDKAVGVVVVKVEFDAMEAAWARAGEITHVTGGDGRILLSSRPAQRFHTLPTTGDMQLQTILPAPAKGWQLHLISSRRAARDQARSTTLIIAMAEALAIFILAWLWRRQSHIAERAAAEHLYREKLELNVALRTEELSTTNRRLSEEINERQQAERRLNVLQVDLVQANKLAALGQITAGVAHEINQPLATIRVLADNALTVLRKPKLKTGDLVTSNLDDIVRMTDRIGHITGELRAFSRKATGETRPVLLKEAVDSSILLNKSRLRDNRVKLIREPIDPKLQVMAERIRFEQVMVNLLQNAFEALEETSGAEVRIGLQEDGDWVTLSICDNGPGLRPDVAEQLFTPFVTTKPKGLGLGLVIAHDILRDFGGELRAETSDAGAKFSLRMRKVSI